MKTLLSIKLKSLNLNTISLTERLDPKTYNVNICSKKCRKTLKLKFSYLAIIIYVVGGVALLVIVGIIVFCCCRKKPRESSSQSHFDTKRVTKQSESRVVLETGRNAISADVWNPKVCTFFKFRPRVKKLFFNFFLTSFSERILFS